MRPRDKAAVAPVERQIVGERGFEIALERAASAPSAREA